MAHLSRIVAACCLLAACLLGAGCGAATPAPANANTAEPASAPGHRVLSPYTYEWFLRAEILAARGKLKEACTAYERALASSDEDPYVLARWARALDLLGNETRAAELLQHAEELAPRAEILWLTRGEIALRHERFDEAVRSFERAEQVAPGSMEGSRALAKTLAATGATERAAAVLERAAAHNPGLLPRPPLRAQPTQPDVKAQLRRLLQDGRCPDALVLLDKHEPTLFGGESVVIETYLRCDAPARAEPLAEVLVAREGSAANLGLRGRVALALGRSVAAAQDLASALARNPDDITTRTALQGALIANGLREVADELSQ